jgi:hypothetical protein
VSWEQAEHDALCSTAARAEWAELLARTLPEHPLLPAASSARVSFARAAVDAFLDQDLFTVGRQLLATCEGTFGCVLTSTLEPGSAVAFAHGQPLSLGFHRGTGCVAIVSERAALRVLDAAGAPAFQSRLDLDLCAGEVARVEVSPSRKVALTLYNASAGRELSQLELERSGRLVELEGNPYIQPLPATVDDRVDADLRDVPQLLAQIRQSFQRPDAFNARTAQRFSAAVLSPRRPKLWLVGITNDLWLAQQFVQNLSRAIAGLEAEAISSNTVLRELGRFDPSQPHVVLAVSQSGQDFPTLAALLALRQRLGSAAECFVLSGELDNLLAEAVGQSSYAHATFEARVFCNHTGFRPTEAATATVSATHHCLVEILLQLARVATERGVSSLAHAELEVLCKRRDDTVDKQAFAIVGDSEFKQACVGAARRWASWICEGLFALVGTFCLLQLNLQFGRSVLPSTLLQSLSNLVERQTACRELLRLFATQADVLFYTLSAPLFVWLLRILQRRTIWDRTGVRELLIADTRWVHQIVWLFARKLFSLSYGYASIKAYAADNQDDLVMTHEPQRGSLLLAGIPAQGRLSHPGARAAMMSIQQFQSSRGLAGAGAHVLTVGHGGCGADLALPAVALNHTQHANASSRVRELSEGMFDAWERLLAMQVFLNQVAKHISRFGLGFDRSRTKDQVFAPTTASPVSASGVYRELKREVANLFPIARISLPFGVVQHASPAMHTPSSPASRDAASPDCVQICRVVAIGAGLTFSHTLDREAS